MHGHDGKWRVAWRFKVNKINPNQKAYRQTLLANNAERENKLNIFHLGKVQSLLRFLNGKNLFDQ